MKKHIGSVVTGIAIFTMQVACQPRVAPENTKAAPGVYKGDNNGDANPDQGNGQVNNGGNGDVGGGQVQAPPAGPLAEIKDVSVLTLIESDVKKLNPAEQGKTRYFTLHVASNAGLFGAEMDAQRQAFKKVINSMSTKPALAKPVAVDADRIVYRLNLDDIGMSAAEFDEIIADHYPFNVAFQDIGSADSIAAEDTDASLRRLLRTDIFMIRMDWFNATATLPIPYQKFMRYPNNLSAFEQQFLGGRVNVNALSDDARRNLNNGLIQGNQVDQRIANILENQVVRTGFDNSPNAAANRVLERHEGRNGGYYVSYDFIQLKLGDQFVNVNGQNRIANQADLDRHNINRTPLGPNGTNNSNRNAEFNNDQIEVMFMLPNGLMGFYLADVRGAQIDKSPTNIIRDPKAPQEFALAMVEGQSMMNLTQEGLSAGADTILNGVSLNRQNFLAADISRINQIYQPTEFKRKMDQDNEQYLSSMKELGIDTKSADPIDASFRFYNRPLSKKDVIAELGLNERDFALLLVDPQFSGVFNALNSDSGFITRPVFQSVYADVVERFKQDVILTRPDEADFIVDADCMDDSQTQMDNCIIRQ